jgi:hypothetical protein
MVWHEYPAVAFAIGCAIIINAAGLDGAKPPSAVPFGLSGFPTSASMPDASPAPGEEDHGCEDFAFNLNDTEYRTLADSTDIGCSIVRIGPEHV